MAKKSQNQDLGITGKITVAENQKTLRKGRSQTVKLGMAGGLRETVEGKALSREKQ